jgi:hypothetical protein
VLVCDEAGKKSKTLAYWRDYEGSIINNWRLNHNVVQSVAAVKQFRREWVAVNALHTIVLGVAKHQTVV